MIDRLFVIRYRLRGGWPGGSFSNPWLCLPGAVSAVTMEFVSTAVVIGIVVVLILLGIGTVINQLLRLKKWLKDSPADPEPPES